LTNATGLPIATGVSGLGTGIASFLATPTSSNLISAITDETGTGALVFANTPTLVSPVIGAATGTSLVLSSTLNVGGAATITGTLTANGTTALNDNVTVAAGKTFTVGTGATTLGGTLGVTGAATFSSTVNVTGVTTLTGAANLNGGLLMDTDKFTVADGTGNTTIAGTLAVSGTSTLTALTATGAATFSNTVKITTGAGLGKVLTSDASGGATWQTGVTTLTTKTANYTLTLNDNYIIMGTDASTGLTFTLPTAVGCSGKEFTIKNLSAYTVSIATTSSQYIIQDNSTATATSANIGIEPSNNWIKVISDGSNWVAFRALF
jgi:hypothetical protein